MLSLGPTRSGLPFHLHGETWLGLVHGKKRWFVYPPGYAPPQSIERTYNPLKSVFNWYETYYKQLSLLDPPPLESITKSSISRSNSNDFSNRGEDDVDSDSKDQHKEEHSGHRPLECVQLPGDVIYLPKAWSHMTLNIGEAIGIGGQVVLPAEDRFLLAQEVLDHNPNNYEALKASGLGLAHLALDEEHRRKVDLIATANGMVELREDNFDAIVQQSEDNWLIMFANMAELKTGGKESEGEEPIITIIFLL